MHFYESVKSIFFKREFVFFESVCLKFIFQKCQKYIFRWDKNSWTFSHKKWTSEHLPMVSECLHLEGSLVKDLSCRWLYMHHCWTTFSRWQKFESIREFLFGVGKKHVSLALGKRNFCYCSKFCRFWMGKKDNVKEEKDGEGIPQTRIQCTRQGSPETCKAPPRRVAIQDTFLPPPVNLVGQTAHWAKLLVGQWCSPNYNFFCNDLVYIIYRIEYFGNEQPWNFDFHVFWIGTL